MTGRTVPGTPLLGARAADPGPWAYAGTTTQMAGLFPFGAGSGAPDVGVPIGRHVNTGEAVCCDPFAWHAAGLVTNLGMMVLGSPGAGKTSLAKRIIRGLAAYGTTALVLGDPKGEYVPITASAGGQVIRVGRGLDRINPLDAGPLAAAVAHLDPPARTALHAQIRGHRLSTLLALCTLARGQAVADWEATVLGAALDTLTHTTPDTASDTASSAAVARIRQPTVGDVLTVLTQAPDPVLRAAQLDDPSPDPLHGNASHRAPDGRRRFVEEVTPLRRTLYGLLEGPLKGVFDGATTTPVDLDAPIVTVDLSSITGAGDTLLAAAMLATWSHGHAVIEAALTLTRLGAAPPRRFLAVLDEMWRALRGAPALVEQADALTRVYRHKAVAHLMLTHSLDDLAAVDTIADRAKTRGLLDRCAITALTAMSDRELSEITALRHLTSSERDVVRSWSSATTWHGDGHHPGRGRYLLKAGDRPGIPVQMPLVGDEPALYDTDPTTTGPATRVAGGGS